MKPMLIIPPAPARWPPLHDLLQHEGLPWLRNLEQRLVPGVPGAHDAYAVMPSSGQFLACAGIHRCGEIGVLGHCFTRPEHRRRGYARRLVTTLLSWFEMTGGERLFLGTDANLDLGLYGKFGFQPLRRLPWAPADRLTMVRARNAADDPFADLPAEVTLRELTRADWPAMVMLLQYFPGPDPRVPLEESAVTAEAFTLDLMDHQERAVGLLRGAFRGSRLVAIGMLATDRAGDRTYGLVIPHRDAPPGLRATMLELARERDYAHVDFPMEALAQLSPGGRPPETPPGPEAELPSPGAVSPPAPAPRNAAPLQPEAMPADRRSPDAETAAPDRPAQPGATAPAYSEPPPVA